MLFSVPNFLQASSNIKIQYYFNKSYNTKVVIYWKCLNKILEIWEDIETLKSIKVVLIFKSKLKKIFQKRKKIKFVQKFQR